MTEHTTRLLIPVPDLVGDESPDGPAQMHAIAVVLDAAAIDSQGILANRPVSTGGSPGIAGRYYFVVGDSTPANNGVLWRDHGTGWDIIGSVSPDSVATVDIQDGAVTDVKIADVDGAKLHSVSVATAAIVDKAVTAGKIADALKPSAGAGGSTEALRAIGTAAGTAAGGDTLAAFMARFQTGTVTLHNSGGSGGVITANVTFGVAFGSTPKVVTDSDQGAGQVTARSTTGFTIAATIGAGDTHVFDWIAIT